VGLTKVMALVDDESRARLVADPDIASLLLIHDLYPVDLETRVRQALESVRPYMESHGGDVELVGITDDRVVQLRLEGHCKTCAASASTLELAIKQALDEYAPDLAGMDVSGFEAPTHDAPVGIELPVIQTGNGNGNGSPGMGVPLPMAAAPMAGPPSWHDIDAAPSPGEITTRVVEGFSLVVGNIDGTLLAYKDECAACGTGLSAASLAGPVLTCPSCAAAFDLSRAGRSLDGGAQLGPVPLLVDDSAGARVALAV
jgi:Fe-S cluster biogenesis protein NfuA/nitrite reductase/ring-hydroxylating ferredoxin subunit